MNMSDVRDPILKDTVLKGYVLEGDTQIPKEYIVLECVGKGGASLVYKVKSKSGQIKILKEIYPYHMAIDKKICRGSYNYVITHSDNEKSKEDLNYYYNNQNAEVEISKTLKYYDEGDEERIFENTKFIANFNDGKNVEYLVGSTSNGGMFSEYINKRNKEGKVKKLPTLCEVLKFTRGIIEAIEPIHKRGYIHADISPDNLLVTDVRTNKEFCNSIIKAIDFNNTFKLENKMKRSFSWKCPYSPLELMTDEKFDEINYCTDIFSVGVILFKIIYNEDFNSVEYSFGHRDFLELSSPYYKNETQEVVNKTIKFISLCVHTNKSIPGRRTKDCGTFIKRINKILKLIDNKHRLESNYTTTGDQVIGRENEIKFIDESLSANNLLILTGMYGVGKSSIVKKYIKKYGEKYDKIITVDYQGSLFKTITSDKEINITNYSMDTVTEKSLSKREKIKLYYDLKLKKINDLVTEKTLLIINNLNNYNDKNLVDVKNIKCKKLITSTNKFTDSYTSIDIKPIESKEKNLEIFKYYYEPVLSKEDEEKTADIINELGALPLAIELTAKVLNASEMKIEELYNNFKNGLSFPGETISIGDGNITDKTVCEHLKTIFITLKFSDEEKVVLRNLCLLPYINVHDLKLICNIKTFDSVNRLVKRGIIEKNNETRRLHPIFSYICYEIFKPTLENSKELINSIKLLDAKTLDEISYRYKDEQSTKLYFMLSKLNGKNEKIYELTRNAIEILTHISEFEKVATLIQKYKNMIIDNCLEMVELHCYLSDVYIAKGDNLQAKKEIDNALCKYEELQVENKDVESKLYNNKALIYNDETSIELFKKSFALQKDNAEESIIILSNLAKLYLKLHRTEEAKEMYKKALDVKIDEKKRIVFALIYNDVANIYTKDDYDKALLQYTNAIEIYEQFPKQKPLEKAAVYNNIGKLHLDGFAKTKENDFLDVAQENFDKSLKIYKEVLGENNYSVSIVYNNKARCYNLQMDKTEAESFYKKSLKVKQSLFGENDIVANAHSNLAFYYAKNDAEENAISSFKQALEIYEKIDIVNEDVARIYERLTTIYSNNNDTENYLKYFIKFKNAKKF